MSRPLIPMRDCSSLGVVRVPRNRASERGRVGTNTVDDATPLRLTMSSTASDSSNPVR